MQYLQKSIPHAVKVEFLPIDKHESLLQIDTMILMEWSSIAKVPKIASLECLCNISIKKLGVKLIFSILNKLKVSCKFQQITSIIDGHDQAFSISLQYLKKEVRNGVHFLHADKLAFVQVGIIRFNRSGQTCPKYPK